MDTRIGEITTTHLRTGDRRCYCHPGMASGANAQTLATFSVLATLAVSNTGPTTIDGNVGLSPGLGPAVTGFPPGLIAGESSPIPAATTETMLPKTRRWTDQRLQFPGGEAV